MIDRATVEKIKDAANIVDVVSEFVSLRKRGANYTGLCPFHNEKTPSFFVSPARGTCHCFGCGKGGNAVTFIMEHEQMTYPEALRWLANKYHIEIQERELTDEERREQSERESMFIINEWAAKYFEQQLQTEGEGTTYGLPYFRSRGFRDDIIAKFRLGYDLQSRFALPDAAKAQGYQPEFLLKTGICYQNDRGELIDRYAGRVVFPWIGLSGKVVGFTARVLDSRTKGVNMKYVNSPDSDIYHKAHELYGIYQAKKAIVKNDRVYLVEGQADVISMHQAGIENVVAGSGTALSFPQIHMLHRLTANITLIYDDDAAGLHAALKGTDMLLSEGMNLKVLLLPDGDDPDSFARKHTADELRQYIDANETDFIQFKTELLLKNETDPVKRTAAINSIIKSISLVTNHILRDTYVQTCVQRIGVAESTLINTMNNFIREAKESKAAEARRTEEAPPMVTGTATQPSIGQPVSAQEKVERLLAQMIIRKGARRVFRQVETEDGGTVDLTVAQYIYYDLQADSLQFSNPLYRRILDEAVAHADDSDFNSESYFIHHEDIEIGRVAADLCVDRLQLMRNDEPDPQDAYIDDRERQKEEEEQLRNQTLHLVLDFRMDYVERRLKALSTEIAAATSEPARMNELIKEYTQLQTVRNDYARRLGTNIVV
ncbi:MAG: DNA primase [Prevotellaceae bacterium]|nr:DNA primase [Prevotella sp.]MDD7605488.1 DNA primase [Prevotellaceae bacterium]